MLLLLVVGAWGYTVVTIGIGCLRGCWERGAWVLACVGVCDRLFDKYILIYYVIRRTRPLDCHANVGNTHLLEPDIAPTAPAHTAWVP